MAKQATKKKPATPPAETKTAQPPIDNASVEPGATPFTSEEVEINATEETPPQADADQIGTSDAPGGADEDAELAKDNDEPDEDEGETEELSASQQLRVEPKKQPSPELTEKAKVVHEALKPYLAAGMRLKLCPEEATFHIRHREKEDSGTLHQPIENILTAAHKMMPKVKPRG